MHEDRVTPLNPMPRRTVLVVDDLPDICQYFRELLRRIHEVPLRIETEVSSRRALRTLTTRSFDIVVSDFRMPAVDGLALLAAARLGYPQGRRILMAADGELKAAPARLRAAKLDAIIRKPFRSEELLLLLTDFITGHPQRIAMWRAEARGLEATATRPTKTSKAEKTGLLEAGDLDATEGAGRGLAAGGDDATHR